MTKLLSVIYVLSVSVWFGGLCLIIIAVPNLFGVLGRERAGDSAALIFQSFDGAKLWLVPLIWVSLWGSLAFRCPGRKRAALSVVVLALATVGFLTVRFGLVPRMEAHRAVMQAARTDGQTDRETEGRLAFTKLHRVSEGLMGANLLWTGLLLVEAAWPTRTRNEQAPSNSEN